MAQKISQLTAKGATIADTDLVEVSQSAGGGAYVSRSVTGANIKALVTDANMSTSDITTNNVSTSKHGFAPKAPNDGTKFLDGTGAYDTVKDSDLSLSDITTNNVSTSKHGFAPKAPNDNTKYLDGTGAWSTPAGGGGGLTVGTTAVTSGTNGRVFFQAGGVLQQSANLTFDTGDFQVGNGTASSKSGIRVWNGTTTNAAGAEFYIGTDNNIYLKTNNANNIKISTPTTDVINVTSNQASITRLNINGASTTPTFSIAAQGTSTSDYPFYVSGLASSKVNLMNGAGQFGINKASNTLGATLDVSAQGALSTDIAFRVRNSADTADILTVAGNRTVWARGGGNQTTNTAFGETAFYTNTTGVENVAIGYGALEFNTTGYRNVAIGRAALNVSTVEGQNTAVGYAALQSNTTAYNNTGIGAVALANNTTGINNTSLGSNALNQNTTGSDNIAIGFESGKRITGGSSLTSATSSIFIGSDTRANSTAQSNQIVIGYQAEGLGSNTVVLGNSSIVTTQLRGNVISGNQAALATTATDGFLYIPTCAGTPTGTPTTITGKVPMVADTTNNKLYIYVGGAWTAMN